MTAVLHLFKNYVKNTPKKAIVQFLTVFLCHLTVAVMKGIGSACSKVYINTRVIKHVYDKRPAEEFDFCLDSVMQTVKYPERIYKNKKGKRGSFCFVKKIRNFNSLVSIETVAGWNGEPSHCEVATFFRPDETYLNGYELLWEWKGDIPSS